VKAQYGSIEEWRAEAAQLFGDDPLEWRFVCPSCGHIAAVKDWKEAGAPVEAAAFSCVGRWLPKAERAFQKNGGPCDYAGGGLFRLNPVKIDGVDIGAFAFAVESK
jgi:hypothetical protein